MKLLAWLDNLDRRFLRYTSGLWRVNLNGAVERVDSWEPWHDVAIGAIRLHYRWWGTRLYRWLNRYELAYIEWLKNRSWEQLQWSDRLRLAGICECLPSDRSEVCTHHGLAVFRWSAEKIKRRGHFCNNCEVCK